MRMGRVREWWLGKGSGKITTRVNNKYTATVEVETFVCHMFEPDC